MTDQPQLNLERIYIKDVSFESPNAPAVFLQPWKPQVKLDLNTTSRALEDGRYEVDLRVTLTTKTTSEADGTETTAMIVEVTQSGVFMVTGFEDEQRKQVLATMCPNILFPYVREQIDSLMVKGGFPPIHLAPVNFDAVYAQAAQAQAEATESPSH